MACMRIDGRATQKSSEPVFKAETCWTPFLQNISQPPPNTSQWLYKPFILSKAIKGLGVRFGVNILSQEITFPEEQERVYLCLEAKQRCMIRQVFLTGNDVPLVYGRVTIPVQTLEHQFPSFEELKQQPIGETLLFNRSDMRRSPFEYACLHRSDPLFCFEPNELVTQTEWLWGRRSQFYLANDPLMITEIFLPAIEQFSP